MIKNNSGKSNCRDLNLDYFKKYYQSGEFEEGLKRYFKITQSMVSCGIGGIMNPNHTMVEADLVFEKPSENQETAIWYFQEAKPFMKKELNDFFEGKSSSQNEESYQKFCKAFAPYISKFWEQAEEEIENFTFLK